jgi:hypothetical protein
MNNTICSAINSKKVIRFSYEGSTRLVEPFCHGVSKAGNDVLRAHRIRGYSESEHEPPWRLYIVLKMSNIGIMEDTFSGDRPDYNRNDSDMSTIYCRI